MSPPCVIKVKGGEENVDFEKIYREYFRDVFLYVRSFAAEDHLAEEIAQETFVKALKAIDTYHGEKDIRA